MSNPVASELLVAQIRRRQCRFLRARLIVGKRHCRLLYIIPVQPELILQILMNPPQQIMTND
ncbi:MAG: hypothetical protein JGK24_14905 [Microcoleus sp. PH2017_29_MFU_D_A]|nr:MULTISPECIES: hypothetical protein [unclassified Microcoleus]MCC3604469.1 hypothetical protein [Microcoleus sp. PH2017_29_MFU_D_A]MCC3635293.1 hypothetical protein [Microcoleus sp. PH2017_37_MFU_D_B]